MWMSFSPWCQSAAYHFQVHLGFAGRLTLCNWRERLIQALGRVEARGLVKFGVLVDCGCGNVWAGEDVESVAVDGAKVVLGGSSGVFSLRTE